MFDSVENSLWHAFDFLAVETNRTSAKKSKLKVIGGQGSGLAMDGGWGDGGMGHRVTANWGPVCYRL